jgi:hypothetical protein
VTTHDATSFAPPTLQYMQPLTGARPIAHTGDRYFALMCVMLLGYALGGRGFAYWGVNPIFIGDIMLVVGVFVIFKSNVIPRLTGIRMLIPLFIFMCWGAACTIPYIDKYAKDAIRDAVVWGYGTYAFIVCGLLIANPLRVQKLILNYRKFVFWFLILGPISSILCGFFESSLPTLPLSGVPIIQVKGGDMCVHLAGCFAYIVALGGNMSPWLAPIFVPLNLGLNMQGRAAMVSFVVAAFIVMVVRPFNARAMRIFFVIALGLFALWASDIRIEKGARELSFNGLLKGFASITGDADDSALDGSKEWRMKWWSDIINYTFKGKYFWMGKGYGVNLATDDGYQVEGDDALRSPHSGHMTMLARGGVPGLFIWIMTQGTWGFFVAKAYLRARKKKHTNWSGLFLFLGAYWTAFMANTSFDVFIEGPMGGIWLWCIYGAGIGCVYVYKRYPELLTPPPPPSPMFVPVSR